MASLEEPSWINSRMKRPFPDYSSEGLCSLCSRYSSRSVSFHSAQTLFWLNLFLEFVINFFATFPKLFFSIFKLYFQISFNPTPFFQLVSIFWNIFNVCFNFFITPMTSLSMTSLPMTSLSMPCCWWHRCRWHRRRWHRCRWHRCRWHHCWWHRYQLLLLWEVQDIRSQVRGGAGSKMFHLLSGSSCRPDDGAMRN